MKKQIGIVILAAGSSRRMGQPKQLLAWEQGTLLEHVVHVSLDLSCQPVVVVLGAECQRIRPVLPTGVEVVNNPHWQEGIASSIRQGIFILEKHWPDLQGVLFLVCDQPVVTTEKLSQMVTLFSHTDKTIVAAAYANTVGIPAIFSRLWFPDLLRLKGDRGAKVLLEKYREELVPMSLPEAQWDIDDWGTYHELRLTPEGRK